MITVIYEAKPQDVLKQRFYWSSMKPANTIWRSECKKSDSVMYFYCCTKLFLLLCEEDIYLLCVLCIISVSLYICCLPLYGNKQVHIHMKRWAYIYTMYSFVSIINVLFCLYVCVHCSQGARANVIPFYRTGMLLMLLSVTKNLNECDNSGLTKKIGSHWGSI